MQYSRLIFIYIFFADIGFIISQNETEIANSFFNYIVEGKNDSAFYQIAENYNKKYSVPFIASQWDYLKKENGVFHRVDSTWSDFSLNRKTIYKRLILDINRVTLKININGKKITSFSFFPFKVYSVYKLPSYCNSDYKEVFVNINTDDNIILPATITIPNNNLIKNIKSPLVVLVHGSGPSNRDEEIGSNKPFKDIACGLAKYNIATIRYEKRTLEYGDYLGLNKDSVDIFDETINDATHILKYASNLEYIDSSNIYVLGHSLGGMCVPKIIEMSPHIKGAILMASPARKLTNVLSDQINNLLASDSADFKSVYICNTLKYQIKILESDTFSIQTKSIFLPFGQPAKYWLSLKNYDQILIAKNIRKKMFFLQGEKDCQVTTIDFNLWKKSIIGNSVSFKLYPKLNHIFFEGKGICLPTEYEQPGHIASYVIYDISKWINKK